MASEPVCEWCKQPREAHDNAEPELCPVRLTVYSPAPEPEGAERETCWQCEPDADPCRPGLHRLCREHLRKACLRLECEMDESRETVASLTRRAEEAERQRDQTARNFAATVELNRKLRAELAEAEKRATVSASAYASESIRAARLQLENDKLRAEAASVAERQREACAKWLDSLGHGALVRAVPLVTEPAAQQTSELQPAPSSAQAVVAHGQSIRVKYRHIGRMPARTLPTDDGDGHTVDGAVAMPQEVTPMVPRSELEAARARIAELELRNAHGDAELQETIAELATLRQRETRLTSVVCDAARFVSAETLGAEARDPEARNEFFASVRDYLAELQPPAPPAKCATCAGCGEVYWLDGRGFSPCPDCGGKAGTK